MKKVLWVGAALILAVLLVAWLTPARKPFTYGIYGGGPPYFDQVERQVTPVPEPSCFCIAGVITLSLIIIRKLRRKL